MADMKILVTPVANRRMRDPRTGRVISPYGENVVSSSFWRRAESDGDVTIAPARRAVKAEEPVLEKKKKGDR